MQQQSKSPKGGESGSGGNVNTAVETQQVDRGQAPEDPPTQPCSIRSLNDGKDASPTDGEHYIGHPNAMSNQGGTTPTTPTFTSAPTDFIHGVSPHDTTYEDGGNDSAEGDSDNDSSIATSPKTRRNLEGDFANSDEAPSTGEGRQRQTAHTSMSDEETKEDDSNCGTGPLKIITK
ncbi:hypothetical protein GN958_ATG00748 [Phytophthora infestans]|uniref:Uncharacterized protein n=2 Tax=Phytophthora infestans TaxID=4787 RepID=A0A8S9VFJ2_PHYIN|nr:hypothetical protein GN958_ATG15129 [Phytophthora infestans]KAF4150122.1 hypothetical protein GN958_ATG00748 [Phytophthora infestans]